MQHDETSLVLRAMNGDQDAFGQLYDSYARVVRAICYDTTGNVQEAQDLAQNVFLRAYEKLGRLKAADRFGPWLVAMAKNICREYRRSKARDRHVLVGLDVRETEIESKSEDDGRIDDLQRAIGQLPEKERMALRVYYLQEQDVDEVTKLLGVSRATFYRLLERAKKRVEEIMSRPESEQTQSRTMES